MRFHNLVVTAQFAIKNYVKLKNVSKCSRQPAHYRVAEERAFPAPIALPAIAAAVVTPATKQEHCLAHENKLFQIGNMTNSGWPQKSKTKCLHCFVVVFNITDSHKRRKTVKSLEEVKLKRIIFPFVNGLVDNFISNNYNIFFCDADTLRTMRGSREVQHTQNLL